MLRFELGVVPLGGFGSRFRVERNCARAWPHHFTRPPVCDRLDSLSDCHHDGYRHTSNEALTQGRSIMSSEIPADFLPSIKETRYDTDLSALFQEDDEEDERNGNCNRPCEEVTCGDHHTFRLRIPPDVGTLFAHRVWSGSKLLAEFLASNSELYVAGKRTIEFGAGTALPSLVALACGSEFSIITDYPDNDILQAIRESVGYNWESCGGPVGRVAVVGHEWGSGAEEILKAAGQLSSSTANDEELFFDLAILSECIWMHRSHAALVQSLDSLLHPNRGVALVTYAHHIPGCEAADDAFFDLCRRCRLEIVHEESHEMAYMWENGKTIRVFLKVLSRRSGVADETET